MKTKIRLIKVLILWAGSRPAAYGAGHLLQVVPLNARSHEMVPAGAPRHLRLRREPLRPAHGRLGDRLAGEAPGFKAAGEMLAQAEPCGLREFDGPDGAHARGAGEDDAPPLPDRQRGGIEGGERMRDG